MTGRIYKLRGGPVYIFAIDESAIIIDDHREADAVTFTPFRTAEKTYCMTAFQFHQRYELVEDLSTIPKPATKKKK